MGQSKRRGSFEERKAQSIQVKIAAQEEKKRAAQERWEALTPEEKEAEIELERAREKAGAALAMWMGFAWGLGGRY